MILIDTNVLSEPIKPQGNPAIGQWLDKHPAEQLFLSAVSLGEALAGIAIMPFGKRRENLEFALDRLTGRLFPSRVLPYDAETARIYATVLATGRARGISIAGPDAQIAATAIRHDMIVATRDVIPFHGVGLRVVNPWEDDA